MSARCKRYLKLNNVTGLSTADEINRSMSVWRTQISRTRIYDGLWNAVCPIHGSGKLTAMSFTFIDLFAGIGGFHAALGAMGGECVYAVERDKKAAGIYELNWGINPLGDITDDANDENVRIPKHDVLAAGFPCQPFSKSGMQQGMEETRGTLYWNILQIISKRKPPLVILENVRNLAGPRHRHEWQVIVETLADQKYRVSEIPNVFSPHLLPPHLGGRPQVRERVFIVGVLDEGHEAPDLIETEPVLTPSPVDGWDPQDWDIETHLPLEPGQPKGVVALSPQEILWIDAWNEFVESMLLIRNGRRLPGFPLWADSWQMPDTLSIARGTPKWKEDFLNKNAVFYEEHQDFIDEWTQKWGIYSDAFPPSRRKLEWQAQDTASLWDTVMHFRPSGIRAKRATYLPALVAITQTSIIGKRKRRLSPREAARLQGLPDWFNFGSQRPSDTYRQLGNGVNVGAVWYVLRTAAQKYQNILANTAPHLVDAILKSPENPDAALADICGHKLSVRAGSESAGS
jgi:DNA (cytosine-5)-methyltransferase 1